MEHIARKVFSKIKFSHRSWSCLCCCFVIKIITQYDEK